MPNKISCWITNKSAFEKDNFHLQLNTKNLQHGNYNKVLLQDFGKS